MIRSTFIVAGAVAALAACSNPSTPAAGGSSSSPPATPATSAPPSPTETAPPTPDPTDVIAGGYGTADVNDPDLKAAQKLAVDALYKKFPQRGLVEKWTAEIQVVAGLNYKFDIQMTGGKHYEAVVYRPLGAKPKLEVTSVVAK
jgi:hypothetical protein